MVKGLLRFGLPAAGSLAMAGSSGAAVTTNIENKRIKSKPRATREFWKEFLGIKKGDDLKEEPWLLCVHKDDANRAILYRKETSDGDKLNLKNNPNCKNTDKNPVKGQDFRDWIDGKLDTSKPASDPITA